MATKLPMQKISRIASVPVATWRSAPSDWCTSPCPLGCERRAPFRRRRTSDNCPWPALSGWGRRVQRRPPNRVAGCLPLSAHRCTVLSPPLRARSCPASSHLPPQQNPPPTHTAKPQSTACFNAQPKKQSKGDCEAHLQIAVLCATLPVPCEPLNGGLDPIAAARGMARFVLSGSAGGSHMRTTYAWIWQ